jgi:hypothetical protein
MPSSPRQVTRGIVVPASPASNWIVDSVPDAKNAAATPLDNSVGIGGGVAPTAKGAWLRLGERLAGDRADVGCR